MNELPRLVVHFCSMDEEEQIHLKLDPPPKPAVSDTSDISLKLPFTLAQIPLLLRALNARQYPDYPTTERLFKRNDDQERIIAQLKELELWNNEANAVCVDVHKRVGMLLGKSLLSDSRVESCFKRLYNESKGAKNGELVLQFHPQVSALASIPWEISHNETQPLLLSNGTVLNCMRIMNFKHEVPTPRLFNRKLRILTIAPLAKMGTIGRAFERLARSEMQKIFQDSPIHIEVLETATMDSLYNRLSRKPVVDVLDYFGHGEFTDEGGVLLFDGNHGGIDEVTASRLTTLPNLPPLIVLQACQSAQMKIEQPLAGIATALSATGVQAVLAMQLTTRMEAVTDVISPTFYQELSQGKSVQQAVAKVRQKLYATEPDGASWYLSTFYIHPKNHHPLILLKHPDSCPENPFMRDILHQKDSTLFIGREEEVQRIWTKLKNEGNISIVGSSGSGKSALLALIIAKVSEQIKPEPKVFSLTIYHDMALQDLQQELMACVGGSNAQVTQLESLLRGKHIILLLDDIGQLHESKEGFRIRSWLRSKAQNRHQQTIQLVATSLKPLSETFECDNSKLGSPLHNILADSIKLGPFTLDEAQEFVQRRLEGTPFTVDDFADIFKEQLLPSELQQKCCDHYETLCKKRGYK